MVTPGWFLRMRLDSRVGERDGHERKGCPKGVLARCLRPPTLSLCCLETFGENVNEQETEGLHHCMNSYTNTAATTGTQISVVKWLIMITTDNLMAALR